MYAITINVTGRDIMNSMLPPFLEPTKSSNLPSTNSSINRTTCKLGSPVRFDNRQLIIRNRGFRLTDKELAAGCRSTAIYWETINSIAQSVEMKRLRHVPENSWLPQMSRAKEKFARDSASFVLNSFNCATVGSAGKLLHESRKQAAGNRNSGLVSTTAQLQYGKYI